VARFNIRENMLVYRFKSYSLNDHFLTIKFSALSQGAHYERIFEPYQ